MKKIALILSLLSSVHLFAGTYSHDVNVAEEFRGRDGLPNFFAKMTAGEPVRIAYLGGSITAAAGWRPKTVAWFQAQYPKAKVIEINPAISGTGSDFSACRLQGDVLALKPDLVFLECRVNGGGGYEAKSVEGVVRHIWKDNPKTDICFVYTLHQNMLKDLQAGKTPWFGPIQEKIANAYGIPTIDLGVEIAQREKAGSLIFKSDAPVEGKLVFSKDGVHPGDEGHTVYCEIIARSMLKMAVTGTAQPHALPAPLEATNWETATLLPITNAMLSAGWTPVDTEKDAVYTESRLRTHAMLRGAVKCDLAGASITVKWNGTTVGISDIPYGEPVILEASVDGGQPITVKRSQSEKTRHARFWYLPEQTPQEHTATFTVKQLPEGQSYYAGQLLIVGSYNTALAPAAKLESDSYDWYARHEAVLKEKDALNPEVVLIGDSITHFWGGSPRLGPVNGAKAFEATFGRYRTLNMGFGWDRTQNVLWRLDHGEFDGLKPRVLILNIGTNNTSDTPNARSNTPEEIAAAVRDICCRILGKSPETRIILMAVFPREEKPDHPRREKIAAINQQLAGLGQMPGVTFLDIGDRLMQADGTISREIMRDFCHPTEKGYQLWGEALAPLLAKACAAR